MISPPQQLDFVRVPSHPKPLIVSRAPGLRQAPRLQQPSSVVPQVIIREVLVLINLECNHIEQAPPLLLILSALILVPCASDSLVTTHISPRPPCHRPSPRPSEIPKDFEPVLVEGDSNLYSRTRVPPPIPSVSQTPYVASQLLLFH